MVGGDWAAARRRTGSPAPAGRGRRRPRRASGADAEPGAVTVYRAPVQGTSPPEVRSQAADSPANYSKSRTASKDPTVISARGLWASGRTAIRRRIATVSDCSGPGPRVVIG